HINIQRSGQRGIAAVANCLGSSRHRTVTVVDGHQLQLVLIGFVVGKSEESESEFISGNSLHQDIIVFTGGIVSTAGAAFSHDGFGEVIKGSRGDSGPEKMDLLVRPFRVDLVPAGDGSLG